MNRLVALMTSRCSYCLQGKVFAGMWRMNQNCPVCDIEFAREDGYFMVSVFIGYVLGTAVVIPVIVAMYLLRAPVWGYMAATAGVLLPLTPLIFRASRLLWLHLDELFDPRDPPHSVYEGRQ